jgi:hypothetical protein
MAFNAAEEDDAFIRKPSARSHFSIKSDAQSARSGYGFLKGFGGASPLKDNSSKQSSSRMENGSSPQTFFGSPEYWQQRSNEEQNNTAVGNTTMISDPDLPQRDIYSKETNDIGGFGLPSRLPDILPHQKQRQGS